MVSNFWQKAWRSVVKSAFDLSMVLLRSLSDKRTRSLKHNFPGFPDSRNSKELSELKSSSQKLQFGKFYFFKKKKLGNLLLNLVQIFQQGCRRSIICVHRDLLGFFSLMVLKITSFEHLQTIFCQN